MALARAVARAVEPAGRRVARRAAGPGIRGADRDGHAGADLTREGAAGAGVATGRAAADAVGAGVADALVVARARRANRLLAHALLVAGAVVPGGADGVAARTVRAATNAVGVTEGQTAVDRRRLDAGPLAVAGRGGRERRFLTGRRRADR